jgi:hypothetical protein
VAFLTPKNKLIFNGNYSYQISLFTVVEDHLYSLLAGAQLSMTLDLENVLSLSHMYICDNMGIKSCQVLCYFNNRQGDEIELG